MRHTRRKRDANHDEVADVWRRTGWTVLDTSAVGSNAYAGFSDLVCIRWPVMLFVEIKAGKAKLTQAEWEFRELVGSPPYVICHSADEAVEQSREWRWANGT